MDSGELCLWLYVIYFCTKFTKRHLNGPVYAVTGWGFKAGKYLPVLQREQEQDGVRILKLLDSLQLECL